MICHQLQKNTAYLRAHDRQSLGYFLDTKAFSQLTAQLKKLKTGYPVAYLLGFKDFWDMRLMVSEATLIPRADSETLIEVLLTLYDKEAEFSLIDLGTGSGALAIAANREFTNATVFAVDNSMAALEIARQNAANWQTSEIQFYHASWLESFTGNRLDCIISNPPYIDENDPHLADLMFEPIGALTAKDNGLADIKTIIKQAETKLKPGGYLLLEHGYNQAQAVQDLFNPNIWTNITTHQDLGGNDRVTVAVRDHL